MDLYEKIEALLNEKKISKRKLAKMINVSPSTLTASFLRKSRSISFEMITKIAEVLDVDVNYLMRNEAISEYDESRIVESEKSDYILNNPSIRHDSDVGMIIYGHDFQMLILALINCLVRSGDKRYGIISTINEIITMFERKEFSYRQIDDLKYLIVMLDSITRTKYDPEIQEIIVKIVLDYMNQYRNEGDTNAET